MDTFVHALITAMKYKYKNSMDKTYLEPHELRQVLLSLVQDIVAESATSKRNIPLSRAATPQPLKLKTFSSFAILRT